MKPSVPPIPVMEYTSSVQVLEYAPRRERGLNPSLVRYLIAQITLVLFGLLGGLVAWAVQPVSYEARGIILVRATPLSDNPSPPVGRLTRAQAIDALRQRPFLDATVASLLTINSGSSSTPLPSVEINEMGASQLIDVRVVHGQSGFAADMANQIMRSAQINWPADMVLLSPATAHEYRSHSITGVGVLAGALIGAVLAWGWCRQIHRPT